MIRFTKYCQGRKPFNMRKVTCVTPNACAVLLALMLAMLTAMLVPHRGYAEQPPLPCHPNPNATADRAAVAGRGDIVNLPQPLKDRLIQLADRPHTYLPMQTFAEADGPSQLFQYYLLDTTGFEPNVFTAILPRVNDQVQLTVTGGNCGLPTIGATVVAAWFLMYDLKANCCSKHQGVSVSFAPGEFSFPAGNDS